MSERMNAGSFWTNRSVLVTGATGQLGCWLVKSLISSGADVVCLVRDWVPQSEFVRAGLIDRVKVVRGDLRENGLLERALAEYEVKTVFHLAAQAIVGVANRLPANAFDVNIRGTWELLEACRHNPTVDQVVIASTDKVYGTQTDLPYHEDMPLNALYPHDVSKACAEMVGRSYAETYGLNVAFTRLPNLYGPGDLNWNRIIPGTIRSALREEPPVIHSNGQFIRDFLYVADGASAHMRLVEGLAENLELRGQAFNISNEEHLTVLELVRKIIRLTGKDLEPDVQDRAKHEILSQYMSAEKARLLLGWQPQHSLDEGLRLTIDWYRTFFNNSNEM